MIIKESDRPRRRYIMSIDEEELEFLLACSKVAYSHNNDDNKEFFSKMRGVMEVSLEKSVGHTPRFWITSSSSLETIVRPPAYRNDSD